MAEINFIETDTEKLYDELYETLENTLAEPLYAGDERASFAKAVILAKIAEYSDLNDSERQCLLKYARGNVLDAMGARLDCSRIAASYASVTLKFYINNGSYSSTVYSPAVTEGVRSVTCTGLATQPVLSTLSVSTTGGVSIDFSNAVYSVSDGTMSFTTTDLTTTSLVVHVSYGYCNDIVIPAGTVVTGDASVYFETKAQVTIPTGDLYAEVEATATETGTYANGIAIGKINYITSLSNVTFAPQVTNITVSSGGTDVQSDEEYRASIALAPNKLTTAGPQGSYEYWTYEYSTAVEDVYAWSPENTTLAKYPYLIESINYAEGITGTPGEVFIHVLFDSTITDTEAEANKIATYFNSTALDKRPITDFVHVIAAATVPYTYNLTVYTTAADLSEVKANTATAISNYTQWQQAKLGRDINPDKLRALILAPNWEDDLKGAQRVDISGIEYTEVEIWQVANLSNTPVVNYITIDDGEVYV